MRASGQRWGRGGLDRPSTYCIRGVGVSLTTGWAGKSPSPRHSRRVTARRAFLPSQIQIVSAGRPLTGYYQIEIDTCLNRNSTGARGRATWTTAEEAAAAFSLIDTALGGRPLVGYVEGISRFVEVRRDHTHRGCGRGWRGAGSGRGAIRSLRSFTKLPFELRSR